jgi:hypothetical protein
MGAKVTGTSLVLPKNDVPVAMLAAIGVVFPDVTR